MVIEQKQKIEMSIGMVPCLRCGEMVDISGDIHFCNGVTKDGMTINPEFKKKFSEDLMKKFINDEQLVFIEEDYPQRQIRKK